MKRVLFCMTAFMLAVGVQASGITPNELKENIGQKVQFYESTGASQLSSVPIILEIEAKFKALSNDYDEHVNKVQKECEAVFINPNYLLASQYCKGMNKTASYYTNNDSFKVGKREVEYRKVVKVFIGKKEVPAEAFWEDNASKVILIKVDAGNKHMKELAVGKPLANLFVASPKQSFVCFDDVVVNAKEKHVDIITCTEEGCFKLSEKAKAGAPVFFLSDKKKNMEFLAGFNTADVDGSERKSCKEYEILSPSLEKFLEQHIDPANWIKVKRKIVDETFFNK